MQLYFLQGSVRLILVLGPPVEVSQWSLKKLTVSTGWKLSRESVTLIFMHTGQNLQMTPNGSALSTLVNARLYKLLSEINGHIVGYTQGNFTQ